MPLLIFDHHYRTGNWDLTLFTERRMALSNKKPGEAGQQSARESEENNKNKTEYEQQLEKSEEIAEKREEAHKKFEQIIGGKLKEKNPQETELSKENLDELKKLNSLLRPDYREWIRRAEKSNPQNAVDTIFECVRDERNPDSEEFQSLLSIPFKTLITEIQSRNIKGRKKERVIMTFLRWIDRPPKGMKQKCQDYVQDGFVNDAIKAIKSKKARLRALEIKKASFYLFETQQQSDRRELDAIKAGSEYADYTEQHPVADPEETTSQAILAQMNAEMEQTINALRDVGIDTTAAEQAAQAQIRETQEKIKQGQQIDLRKRQEMHAIITDTIRTEISRNVNALHQIKGNETIELLRSYLDQIEAFSQYVQQRIQSKGSPANQQDQRTIAELQHTRAKMQAIYRIAEWSKQVATGKMTEADLLKHISLLNEEEQEALGIDDNTRQIITALIEHTDKVEKSVSTVSAKLFGLRSLIFRHRQKAQQAEEQSEQSAVIYAIREAQQIAEETGISIDRIRDAILHGDLPRPHEYAHVARWAEENGLDRFHASRIVTALQPVVSNSNWCTPEFLNTALTNHLSQKHEDMSEDEREQKKGDLLHNSKSFLDLFATSHGLSDAVMKGAIQQFEEQINITFGAYDDVINHVEQKEIDQMARQAQKDHDQIRNALAPPIKRAQSLAPQIQLLRNKIQNSNTEGQEVALMQLGKIHQLLQSFDPQDLEGASEVMGIGESALASGALQTHSELAQRIKENGIHNAARQFEEKLDGIQQFLQENQNTPPDQIIQQLRSRPSLLPVRDLTAMSRLEHRAEENERAKLQQLADFITHGKNPKEVLSSLENLKNADGSPVLRVIEDNEWNKKYGGDTKAFVEFQKSGGFHISLPQSVWDHRDADEDSPGYQDLITSLRHEGYHLLDAATRFKLSKQLKEALEEIPEWKDENGLRDQFAKKLGLKAKHREIPMEALAYYLSDEDDPLVNELKQKLKPHLDEDFWDAVDQAKRDFVENGIKVGLFDPTRLNRTNLATKFDAPSSSAPTQGQRFHPNNNRFYNFSFANREKKIEDQLSRIRGSKAGGKAEFIQDIEETLDYLRDLMREGIDDNMWEVVCSGFDDIEAQTSKALALMTDNESGGGAGFLRETWNNTEFLSFADVVEMFKTGKNYIERRHARKSKRRVGLYGQKALDKINPGMAYEFRVQEQASEGEEVSEYTKGLEHMDPWEIMDEVERVKDNDQLKACMDVLADKGALDIYDPRLWRALEKLTHRAVVFNEHDANDPISLRSKWQKACSMLFDTRHFNEISNKQNSADKSEQEAFAAEVDANQTVLGGKIEAMIRAKRAGEEVDPHKYKKHVFRCIEVGKSDPKSVFWYMIQGAHFGISNPDWFNEVNAEVLNSYPPIEWFYNNKPTIQQVQALAEMFPPTKEGSAPDNWNDFFFTHIMTDKFVQQRTKKASSQASDKWDHDWSQEIAVNLEISEVESLITLYYGAPRMNPTAMANMPVGHVRFLMGLAKDGHEIPEKRRRDLIIQILSTVGKYNALTMDNIGSDKSKFFTFNKKELGRGPRLGTSLYSGKKVMTTGDMLEIGNDLIKSLDPQTFDFIGKPVRTNEEVAKYVTKIQNKYPEVFGNNTPTTPMDLINRLPDIIDKIVEKNGIDAFLHKAEQLYNRDNGANAFRKNQNTVDYERGINWKQTAQQTLGKAPLSGRGMYSRAA